MADKNFWSIFLNTGVVSLFSYALPKIMFVKLGENLSNFQKSYSYFHCELASILYVLTVFIKKLLSISSSIHRTYGLKEN